MDQTFHLIEPDVKNILNNTLKQCYEYKKNYNNILLNIWFFILFCVTLTTILIYIYKGKLTPEQIEEKEMIKKKYILDKIRIFQENKKKEQQRMITGLPYYEQF